MPYEPIIPKGQHLGDAHSVDGAVVGHLFDKDNKLKGHAAWLWVDEPEESYHFHDDEPPSRPLTPEEIEQLVYFVGAVVLGVVKVVELSAPVVKRLWVGKVAPAIKSGVGRIKKIRWPKRREIASAASTVFVASASGVIAEVKQSQIRMSRAEWEQRLHAMLAAKAFVNEQARLLSEVLVEEPGGSVEASPTTESIEPKQFAAQITKALEAHPELLTEAAMAEVLRAVEPKRSPEGMRDGPEGS